MPVLPKQSKSSNTNKLATTTIVTFTDSETHHDYVLLSIGDPRPRLRSDGTYEGIPALDKDGLANSLPLDRIKFIGGYRDEGETIEDAGYRELTEEAGKAVADMAREVHSVKTVYTMQRSNEWRDAERLTLTYIHAHLGSKTIAEMKEALNPGDDSFGIAIVEADKIKLKNGQYVIEAGFSHYKIGGFTTIDYSGWLSYTSEKSRAAFDYYNKNATENPTLGLDLSSIGARDISMYVPTKQDHSFQCALNAKISADVQYGGSGGACPDGAIFTDLVRPSLLPQHVQSEEVRMSNRSCSIYA